MKTMLSDTILALCRNTLPYEGEVSVEGLIGITLDNKEIFLVSINETIQKEGYLPQNAQKRSRTEAINSEEDSSQESDDAADSGSLQGSAKRKRRRRRKSKEKTPLDMSVESNQGIKDGASQFSDQDADTNQFQVDEDNSNMSAGQVKSERNGDDEEDLVFVKEEPQDNSCGLYGQSQPFGAMPGTSQSSDSYSQDPALEFSQLQELAFQLAGDGSSSRAPPTSTVTISIIDFSVIEETKELFIIS